MFRWSIKTPEGSRYRSDWQLLSHAKGLDSNLIREFVSRFGTWSALGERDFETVNRYLEAYKQATLAGRHFVPLNEWAYLHQVFTPFLACQGTLVEQLATKHPSADFCYVKPDDQNPEAPFWALCRGRLWSSAEWIAPAIWVEQAEQLFPSTAVADDGNSRSIASEVRREVWRRDSGRCRVVVQEQGWSLIILFPLPKMDQTPFEILNCYVKRVTAERAHQYEPSRAHVTLKLRRSEID
jgi:hypothetical protein